MKPKSNAFTLIELLVVIAIIAILALLVTTGLMSFKERAQLTKCSQNLRAAGMEYFQEFHGMDRIGVGYLPAAPAPGPTRLAQSGPECPWCNPSGGSKPRNSTPGGGDAGTRSLNVAGACPKAGPNPMYEIDAETQPPVRSFGVAEPVSRGRNWSWMLADSDFEIILEPAELPIERHDGKISVFYKDGSVVAVRAETLVFPDEEE